VRGVDDARDVQIALARCGLTDANGAIGGPNVTRVRVGVRVDRDRFDAEFPRRMADPHGNLAAVGDQKALDHDQRGFRLSRKARKPSCPSGDTRRVAIARAVMDVTSSTARPETAGISAFAAATASGAADKTSST